MSDMADVEGQVRCESHHWVSANVPGLLVRWVIQCSICGAYNVEEMNAALSAAGFGLVADAKAEALESAAVDAEGMHDPAATDCMEWADWLRARAEAIRGEG